MKVYYQLAKTKKRIQLEDHDIQALLFLNEQGLLSQPQFHEFYNLLKPIDEAAFRRKMSRWDDANIINKAKQRLQDGHEIALIDLTHAGQTILKKLGFIPHEDSLKYKPKRNIDHTLTIKQSVIEFLKVASGNSSFYFAEGGKYIIPLKPNAIKYNVSEPVKIYKKQNLGTDVIPSFDVFGGYNLTQLTQLKERGILVSYVPSYLDNDLLNGLTPDWVFQVKDDYFYIEVDSGSEKVKTARDRANFIINKFDVKSIEGKLYRYEEMAKALKKKATSEGKKYTQEHHVIFALMDDSKTVITTNIQSKKDTRIANLKHDIGFMDNFGQWNVDVYVVGMKRYAALMKKLRINSINKKEVDYVQEYLKVLNALYKLHLVPNGWKTTIRKAEQFKSLSLPTNLNYNVDAVYMFLKEVNQFDQYILPLFIQEGNVLDMEKLAYFTEPIGDGRFKTDAKILAIYRTKDELENDIFRKTKNVYTNKHSGVRVDNNGMDTDNILMVAVDELANGILKVYDTNKNEINVSQLFL